MKLPTPTKKLGDPEIKMFGLTKAHSDSVLKFPEHGMGYQFVEVLTGVWATQVGHEFVVEGMALAKGDQWRKGVVINA